MSRSTRAVASVGVLFAVACSTSSSPPESTGPDASAYDAGAVDAASGRDSGEDLADSAARDGSSDPGATEAASGPTCGPAPDRYTVLMGASAGLVMDNTTMLVWMADSTGGGEPPQTQSDAATYCTGRGMRLPTEGEALGIAAADYAACAFGQWGTWTSTEITGMAGYAWVVDYLGDTYPQIADNYPSAVLCVRDSTD